MRAEEVDGIAAALGRTVTGTRTLAGGFSHETCLLTLTDGQVVARLGGPDPAVEAAVMEVARRQVPVPEVLLVIAGREGARPAMVLEHVAGTPLSEALLGGEDMGGLGEEVGRVVARIGAVTFGRPGFFADERLTVEEGPPWSRQLPEFAENCMRNACAQARLDLDTREVWAGMCAAEAPALAGIDDQARLAHADINPKNILVTRARRGWRVDAVLDWEFGYSGCPYGDAANMARFAADHPPGFLDGFRSGFAGHQPADLPLADDWEHLGEVLDMFALSDLVTRPAGHPVADQAAGRIRSLVAEGRAFLGR
jgi:Ser/Thr protein kinase RdoA (MazF antagonist)